MLLTNESDLADPGFSQGIELVMIAGYQRALFSDHQGEREAVGQ